MPGSKRGTPYLQIRLDPEVMELLRERAGDAGPGRGGGVSLYVRQLIYRDLGLPEPEPYAPQLSPRNRKLRERQRSDD